MTRRGDDRKPVEDQINSRVHVISRVRMRKASGREEYTVPHRDVIDVAHRRVRATSPAGGLLARRR